MTVATHGAAGRLLSLTRRRASLLLLAAAMVSMPLHAAAPKRTDGEPHASAQTHPAPDRIQASALQQMAVLKSIKSNKSARQHKIDSRLFLGILNAQNDARVRALTDFRFVRPESDGLIEVEVILSSPAGYKPVFEQLARTQAQVTWRASTRSHLLARVRMDAVEALAAMAQVKRVRLPIPALAQAINTSEGDVTHAVNTARSLYGITGAGVKICALSDGIDSLAALQASDDLPAVDVLPGQAGSGSEGTAMLEIIHDLAPDAELGFATANPTETQFAQNILDLAADGCDIIVDDIIYLAESPFQDGPVAQAVNTVTAAGVLYFSSAGNEGNKDDGTSGTWEGDFAPSAAADPGPLAGANLHDFGDGNNSILVEFGGGNPPLLIWAEHYDAVNGSASTDFDLYDMDGGLTTIFDASTDVQDGTGGDDFPIELIGGGAFGGERLLIDRFAAGSTSSVPMFNLILFRGELDDNLTTGGTTRGHSAAADAYSVAATPVAASFDGVTPDGPFPGPFTGANESEGFSADGPRRIILDPAGNEITAGNRTSTGGVVRQKPDITAADGNSTATPGFETFYGTSAAAPHAAAIAALMRQAVPSATPAQIRTALVTTAIDIEAPGVDRTTGAGIIMAGAALQALGAEPQAYLGDGMWTFTQRVGDGDATVEPNEDWSIEIPLENIGGIAASAISATLTTTTPGITIIDGTSGYPDLAIAATATNAQPFSFYVTPAASCGVPIDFELTVTYTGGAMPAQTFAESVSTGGMGAPQTFSSSDGPIAIPDGTDSSGTAPGAPAASTIAAAGIGSIHAVSMRIDGETCDAIIGSTTVGIDHSFVGDLDLTLVSPTGTEVLAINNAGVGGNNFCQTELSDTSAGPDIQTVVAASAPFTGSFLPNASFAAYSGEAGDGNWTLRAQDFFTEDTGNLRAWSVTLTPAVCDAPPQVVALTAEKTVTGSFAEGGNITYTIVVTNTGNGLQLDNPGNEFGDMLPAGLVATTVSASSGTVALVGNIVSWNGSLLPGAAVTITIDATIDAGTAGDTIANQATLSFDADRDGSNDTSASSDDPGVGGAADPTAFTVLQGELSITPTAIDFGNVAVGDSSAVESVELENIGDAPLDVTGIDVPAVAGFAQDVSSTCGATPFTLAPGDTCTLDYTFSPTAAGAANDTIAITANAPGGGNITLSGVGTQGTLAVTPTAIDFGDLPPGNISSAEMVVLSNTGDGALQVTSFPVPSAPFSRQAFSSCPEALPFVLAAGADCAVYYLFQPTAAGDFSEVLVIEDDAGGSTAVTLTGTGALGQLAVTPTALDFGDVEVGEASAPLGITVSNPGNAATFINGIGNGAPFTRDGGTCPTGAFSLAAGDSCTATFVFTPTFAGEANQTFDVIAANSEIPSIGISATGTGITIGAVITSSLDFGEVAVGEGGAVTEQGVGISNTGSVPVEITAFGDADAPFYYAGTTCAALPFTLQPGEFCIVGYGFSPTEAGEFAQTLTFATSFGDLQVELAATAIAGATPPGLVEPLHIPAQSNLGLLLMVALLALIGIIGLRRQM